MLNKIMAIAAYFVIAVLVIVSLFPNMFSSRLPSQTILPCLLPNNGDNELVIYNVEGDGFHKGEKKELIIIDSVLLRINDKKVKLSDQLHINFNESHKITFNVSEITKDFNKDIDFLFMAEGQDLKIFMRFTINNDDPEVSEKYKVESSPEIEKAKFSSKFRQECGKSIKTLKNRLAVKAILGTDSCGYDIFARIIYGTRIVMAIVMFSSILSLLVGVFLGFVRGFYNNWLTQAIRVISELFSSMSLYVVAILINIFFGKNVVAMIIAFSIIQWVEIETYISMKVRNILNEDYIKASRMVGKSDFVLMIEDVLPVIAPDILISFFYLAKRILVIEASLSYIRYSVELPFSTWGSIISDARSFIFFPEALHFVLPSVIAIIVTSLSFNVLEIIYRKKFRT